MKPPESLLSNRLRRNPQKQQHAFIRSLQQLVAYDIAVSALFSALLRSVCKINMWYFCPKWRARRLKVTSKTFSNTYRRKFQMEVVEILRRKRYARFWYHQQAHFMKHYLRRRIVWTLSWPRSPTMQTNVKECSRNSTILAAVVMRSAIVQSVHRLHVERCSKPIVNSAIHSDLFWRCWEE